MLSDNPNNNILELIYHPKNFPDIYSYYLMNDDDIAKFVFDYKELEYNPIKNFLYDDILSDSNLTYAIYSNTKSDYYRIIYDYISITSNGGSCNILSKFYESQKINDLQSDNVNQLFISDDKFDSENKNSDSSDSIYNKTENIVNIINLFNIKISFNLP